MKILSKSELFEHLKRTGDASQRGYFYVSVLFETERNFENTAWMGTRIMSWETIKAGSKVTHSGLFGVHFFPLEIVAQPIIRVIVTIKCSDTAICRIKLDVDNENPSTSGSCLNIKGGNNESVWYYFDVVFTNPMIGTPNFPCVEDDNYTPGILNGYGEYEYIIPLEELIKPEGVIIGPKIASMESPKADWSYVVDDETGLITPIPPVRGNSDITPGVFFQQTFSCADCGITKWEIDEQNIPGTTLIINSSGVVTSQGSIPEDIEPGEYYYIIKVTNNLGHVNYRKVIVTIKDYEGGTTWGVLGSTPEEIYQIFQHSSGFYLVSSIRRVYKTTDFVSYTEVYDAGLNARGMSRIYELEDKKVVFASSKPNTYTTYTDIYSVISNDETCGAFTERAAIVEYSLMCDAIVSDDGLHLLIAFARSNKTRLAKILISDGSVVSTVESTTSTDRVRTFAMEHLRDSDTIIMTNKGTTGLTGVDSIYKTENFITWEKVYTGTVSHTNNLAYPPPKTIYTSSDDKITLLNAGKVQQTTDNGVTWNTLHTATGVNNDRPAFLLVNAKSMFVAQTNTANGKVYRTVDKWATATEVYTATGGRKPSLLYKNKSGKIILVLSGTSNNVLESD